MTVVDNDQIEERLTSGILGQWYVVAKSVQVKSGKPHAVKALGRNLVLWRGGSGRLHCLEDYCPHRGAPLSRGEVVGDNVSCRYHGVTLDGSGTIVRVPAMPGCALEGRKAVDSYAVIEANDGVFVYFPSAERPEPCELKLPAGIFRSALEQHPVHEPLGRAAIASSTTISPIRCTPATCTRTRFTLAFGAKQDVMQIEKRDDGFYIARVEQKDVNLDWTHVVDRRHAGLLPARHPVSGGRRPRRAVPHHRLHHAGR